MKAEGNKQGSKRPRNAATPLLGLNGKLVRARERWLYENPVALAAVEQGLADARAGRFASAPDLAADALLACVGEISE